MDDTQRMMQMSGFGVDPTQNLSAEKDGLDIIQHEWILPKMEQRAAEVLQKLVKSHECALFTACPSGAVIKNLLPGQSFPGEVIRSENLEDHEETSQVFTVAPVSTCIADLQCFFFRLFSSDGLAFIEARSESGSLICISGEGEECHCSGRN
ncbi:hypothetical protein HPP92_000432 [Vanilla planifolia]|uniref:Uncharacterized protein n=1 Tax=Vanilla planifolia TaxID=51239 RepID=A0A835RXG4_VANPL|nr:hypothetical protein HPP92_000432 [Vanilla planifolia]